MEGPLNNLTVNFFIFLSIAIIFILIKIWKKNIKISTKYPYQQKSLFSHGELSFLHVLYQTIGDNAKIFGKVRVADILTTKKGLLPSYRQQALNKITQKHFDFILCNNNNFTIICAIELNDKSHLSEKRKPRDKFLEGICETAGLPLIQITAKRNYIINDIKEQLSPYLYLN